MAEYPLPFYSLKSRLYQVALKAAANLTPGKVWPGANGSAARILDFDPKLAVVGLVAYKLRWPCATCGDNSTSLLLPAICGIAPWDWPWPFAEPDLVPVDGARGMVKAFYLSYRPLLEKRCLPFVGVRVRVYLCNCGREHVEGRISYFALRYRKNWEQGQKQGVQSNHYLEACRKVAESFPELQKVQRIPEKRSG